MVISAAKVNMKQSHVVKKILYALEYGITATAISFQDASLRRKEYLLAKALDHLFLNVAEKNKARQNITRLYLKRKIEYVKKGNRYILQLTESGKKRLLDYKLEEIIIQPQKIWDGMWRIIIFDIPEKKKSARDSIGFHLRRMGCAQIQDSVFVTPYQCRDEIDFLTEYHDVGPYMRLIEAVSLDGADALREHFALS